MGVSRRSALAWAVAFLTATPTFCQIQQASEAKAATDRVALIARFLADQEGKETHDFPAWIDYKQIAGDSAESRAAFAGVLKAEPELCAAVGGDAQMLADLLVKRARALTRGRRAVAVENGRVTDYGVSLPQVAALMLVARAADVSALVNEDFQIQQLAGLPPLVQREKFSPTQEHLEKWRLPDKQLVPIKRLMSHWATREADGQMKGATSAVASRYLVACSFCLDDALEPLALEVLRHPEISRASAGNPFVSDVIRHALVTTVELGNKDIGSKDKRRLLEPFLEKSTDLRGCVAQNVVDIHPQVRDLALSSIVQLSGDNPQDYGFAKFDSGVGNPARRVQIYLFHSTKERNQGFELCKKNFQQLGLQQAPAFAPGIIFVRTTEKSNSGKTSRDGKVRLEVEGHKARLIDVATGKPIGKELNARLKSVNTTYAFDFTCWSFSPDGKYVVTGSRYHLKGSKGERPTNYGQVEVWDAATGEFVERYHKAVGGVWSVGFRDDGSPTVLFEAQDFSMDKS